MPTLADVPSDLLNIKQTADLLGVHRNTVTSWIKQGILVPAVSGPRVSPRIRRSDVEKLLSPEPTETVA